MGAGERARSDLIGVARHTETEELFSLVVSSNTIVATPEGRSDETWLGDAEALAQAGDPVAGQWRHFKGAVYNFVACAKDAATGEDLVVYTGADGRVWIRPKRMVEEIVHRDGRDRPRFARM